MLHIECLPLGRLQTNCYILWGEDAARVVVIDPGDDRAALSEALRGKTVEAVLITHAHYDHILGLPAVLCGRIYVHTLDFPAMTDPVTNCAEETSPLVPATDAVNEGDTVTAAGLTFTVLHTPGHTRGSVCYQCGNDLFSGDTLFAAGYGRTDLPGGSWTQLVSSLRRLLHLPGETLLHPGHGEEATLNHIRGAN